MAVPRAERIGYPDEPGIFHRGPVLAGYYIFGYTTTCEGYYMARAALIVTIGIILSLSASVHAESDFSVHGADGRIELPKKTGIILALGVNTKTCTAYFALSGEKGIGYEAPVCDCAPEYLEPPKCMPKYAAAGTECTFTSFIIANPDTGMIPVGGISCK